MFSSIDVLKSTRGLSSSSACGRLFTVLSTNISASCLFVLKELIICFDNMYTSEIVFDHHFAIDGPCFTYEARRSVGACLLCQLVCLRFIGWLTFQVRLGTKHMLTNITCGEFDHDLSVFASDLFPYSVGHRDILGLHWGVHLDCCTDP